MAGLAFDTLDASKTLRNAGVDERMAEAIVQIVQRTTEMPDISHLATKGDIAQVRQEMATKDDIARIREDMLSLELRLSERLRTQGWQLVGAMAALFGIAVALVKLVP